MSALALDEEYITPKIPTIETIIAVKFDDWFSESINKSISNKKPYTMETINVKNNKINPMCKINTSNEIIRLLIPLFNITLDFLFFL